MHSKVPTLVLCINIWCVDTWLRTSEVSVIRTAVWRIWHFNTERTLLATGLCILAPVDLLKEANLPSWIDIGDHIRSVDPFFTCGIHVSFQNPYILKLHRASPLGIYTFHRPNVSRRRRLSGLNGQGFSNFQFCAAAKWIYSKFASRQIVGSWGGKGNLNPVPPGPPDSDLLG